MCKYRYSFKESFFDVQISLLFQILVFNSLKRSSVICITIPDYFDFYDI